MKVWSCHSFIAASCITRHADELEDSSDGRDQVEADHDAQDAADDAVDLPSHGGCAHLVQHCEWIETQLESALWLWKEWLNVWISSCSSNLVGLGKGLWNNSYVKLKSDRLLLFLVFDCVSCEDDVTIWITFSVGLHELEWLIAVCTTLHHSFLQRLVVVLLLESNRGIGQFAVDDHLSDVKIPLANQVIRLDKISVPALQ